MASPAPGVVIGAFGHYVPPRAVRNEDLPASLNASSEWIERRTGIKERRYVEGAVTTSDLAAAACRSAIANGGFDPQEIDCLITATLSPDHCFPGLGVYTQTKLGLRNVPAYDVRTQCSGFLYSLNVARAFIHAGIYRRVLVVCAELQSRCLGKLEIHRHVTPLFGDGAAAVVVMPAEERPGGAVAVDYVRVYADGAGADTLRLRLWDLRLDSYLDWEQVGEPRAVVCHPEMDGPQVFRAAVNGMVQAARKAVESCGLDFTDIHWLVPHQANLLISQSVAMTLELPWARVMSNIDRYGNTTSASIPLLLSEAAQGGLIERGQRLLCVAFGSGFTWGAAVLRAT